MDLHCAEDFSPEREETARQSTRCSRPWVVGGHCPDLGDQAAARRVLGSLLVLEKRYAPAEHAQPTLPAPNRRLLVSWMTEVCSEQEQEPSVLPLAVSLVDRCLSARSVPNERLQLLAAACLLLASKLRACAPLSASLLAQYTANSVSAQQVVCMELLVTSWLHWDVSSVTALDLLEPLICAVRVPLALRGALCAHAAHLAALACTDSWLSSVRASCLAAACLACSVSAVRAASTSERLSHSAALYKDTEAFRAEIDSLSQLVDVPQASMRNVQRRLNQLQDVALRNESDMPSGVDSDMCVKNIEDILLYERDRSFSPTDIAIERLE